MKKPFLVRKSKAIKNCWNVIHRSDNEIVAVKTSKSEAKWVAKERNKKTK